MGDYRTTAGEKLPLSKRQRRTRLLLFFLLFLVVLAGIGSLGWYVEVDRYVLASGYVTTERYAEVRPPTTGIVAEILVKSGMQVEKGQAVVRLVASEEQATLEEAKNHVQEVEAELSRREAEIGELKRKIEGDIETANLRLQNASAKLLRTRELLAKGLVAASALEDEKLKEDLARVELHLLKARDQSIHGKELAVLRQKLEARRDAVSRAEARVRAKEIQAPIAGSALRYEFVIGELVRPETVLLEIFGGEKQVLKLRVAERYAVRVAPQQRYSARLASYRGLQPVRFEGEVQHVRGVIQAEGQKTYRVAYCSFDASGHAVPPGTSAEAKIYYGRSCLWFYLFGVDW